MNTVSRLHILLVMPDGHIHKLKLGSFKMSFREAPLTATMLAALVPPELGAQIEIADESVERVPFEKTYDLVAISCMTGTAVRGYQIADQFRARGVKVVLGGVHVTLLPDEAACHADAIVTGFAEQVWPQLLRDLAQHRLQSRYAGHTESLAHLPAPRRDLQNNLRYLTPNTVLVTRGCQNSCDFCTVAAIGFGWHTRPVTEVIDEIRQLRSRRFAISDVHLTQDPAYAKEFLRALVPLKKQWGGLASTKILEDDELLELLHRSGCKFLLIGFESVNPNSLLSIQKGFNQVAQYQELLHKLHALHIVVLGCFIFGLDEDDHGIFAHTVDLVNQLHVDIPRYAIYTPYPGTKTFYRLEAEGRLLHKHWQYYDTQHVVFQPQKMSPQELDAGFKWAFRETYKLPAVTKRTWGTGLNFPVAFFGNLAYTLYIKRLMTDPDRFPEEPFLPQRPQSDAQSSAKDG